jgi:hypothetical protein
MNATAITDGVLTIDGVPATPIFGTPLPTRLLVRMSPAIDPEHLVGAVAQCAVHHHRGGHVVSNYTLGVGPGMAMSCRLPRWIAGSVPPCGVAARVCIIDRAL